MQYSKSHNHHFNIDVATEYGLHAAILLANLQYWIKYNQANGVNKYFGRTWSFNSARAFKELFPYMTERTISRTLKKLCDIGVLQKGNFNRKKFDKTIWYAFANEEEWLSNLKFNVRQNGERISQSDEPISQDGERIGQNGEPIPDNKRQIVNPDKNQHTLQNASDFSLFEIFEKNFEKAFSQEYLNLEKANWGAAAIEAGIDRFKKMTWGNSKYHTYNIDSLRNAFQYQLNNDPKSQRGQKMKEFDELLRKREILKNV